MLLFALWASVVLGKSKPKPKKYADIAMPELRQGKLAAKVVCPSFPTKGERYPVIGYGHGDTVSPNSYRAAMQMMADEGFCCVAYRSCQSDSHCDDGRADFIEMLKMFKHLDGMTPSDDLPINMTAPLSVAGHSTGGRLVLEIGALQSKNTEYLKGKPQEKLLTPDLRAILPRIKVLLADHPDEMYATTSYWSGKVDNADPARFRVTDTPTFIWTGSDDTWIEPRNSSWRDFADYIQSPERMFMDSRNEGHLRVMGSRPYSPRPFVEFIRLYAFGNETSRDYFFGDNPGILSPNGKPWPTNKDPSKVVPDERKGATNNAYVGPDKKHATSESGFLACSKKYGEFSIPKGQTTLCHVKPRYEWKDGRWDIPKRCRVTVDATGKYRGSLKNGKVPKDC